MKKLFATIMLMAAAAIAFALPAPAQIEDALAAHRFEEARSMIKEVLRERPDSARAHLLNSYVLVHVDHNRAAANAELETARGLDKRGDVKSSPLAGRIVAEIEATPVKQTGAKGAPQYAPDNSGWTSLGRVLFYLLVALVIVAIIAAIYEFVKGSRTQYVYLGSGGGSAGGPAPLSTILPIIPNPNAGGVALGNPTALQPAHQPMGPLGTAASVAGGVVAGNAINDLLHSRSGSHRNDDWEESRRRRNSDSSGASDSSSVTSSPVSNETTRLSFSSGSGSSDWGGSSDSGSSGGWD